MIDWLVIKDSTLSFEADILSAEIENIISASFFYSSFSGLDLMRFK